MELQFPGYYDQKAFVRDVSRLRDLASNRDRGQKIPWSGDGNDFIPTAGKNTLNEAELDEVAELRRRLRRVDADTAMMLVIETRLHGGLNFF